MWMGQWVYGCGAASNPNKGHNRAPAHAAYAAEALEPRVMLAEGSGQIDLFSTSQALFVENQGQWPDPAIRYAFQGDGATVLHTDQGPVFQLYQQQTEDAPVQQTRFSVHFDGAATISPIGQDRSDGVFNYFLGDPSQWRSNVPAYQQVVYPGLYDGIDLHTWGQRNSLKYEFHLAPGADYRQIQISYDGVLGLSLADDGSLHVQTALGEMVDGAPYVYQVVDGKQVKVATQFQLMDQDTYTFRIAGAYDANTELVIDPDLAWSTYLGGAGLDMAQSVAVDSSGNVLVTGDTASAGWASGGFDPGLSGSSDGFVAKFNASGQHQWSTYLGGSGSEGASDVAVDGAGNVMVIGYTDSAGWASGGFDTGLDGPSDAFVAKLSASGQRLWSTYLGGSDAETGYALVVDSAGNVLATGRTTSPDWVFGGLDTSYEDTGYADGFVVKLSGSGQHLWSSYMGGSGEDISYGVAVDSHNNVLVGGYTNGGGWTSGGFDTGHNGNFDGFLVKTDPTGQLLWSTYLGGSDMDDVFCIAADSTDNIVVTGSTKSAGWTANGFDTTFNGDMDSYVAKLNASGQLMWSTYIGGAKIDYGEGIVLDSAGNALVTGMTVSSGWTIGGCDTSLGGQADAYVAKIGASGTFLWSTYVGGSGVESGAGIARDTLGNAFAVGYTTSGGWITGGYDTSFGGDYDAFLAKIHDDDVVNQPPTLTAINTISGATEGTAFTISYTALAAAANEDDPEGDLISFRVEWLLSGTLTKNGAAVVPGTTLLSSGENWTWTSASSANGIIAGFTIKAYDGTLASASAVTVNINVSAVVGFPIGVSSGPGAAPGLRIYASPGQQLRLNLAPYDSGFLGGSRLACGDLTGDGTEDWIAGTGPGAAHVKVLDGVTGQIIPGPLGSFLVYPGPGNTPQDPTSDYYRLAFTGGIFVASGDVDGDGRDDLITAADSGAGPHVKVYSGATGQVIRSFWAFDQGFQGGVRIASGDLDGDGYDDIIAASGPGAAHVRVFSGKTGQLFAGPLSSFLVYPGPGKTPQDSNSDYYRLAFKGGIYVAAGDVNGDGKEELITAADSGAGPHVKVFNPLTGSALASFWAFDQSFQGGVRIATGDVNGDGRADIIAGTGAGAAQVKVFDIIDFSNPPVLEDFIAYDGFAGGVWVAGN